MKIGEMAIGFVKKVHDHPLNALLENRRQPGEGVSRVRIDRRVEGGRK